MGLLDDETDLGDLNAGDMVMVIPAHINLSKKRAAKSQLKHFLSSSWNSPEAITLDGAATEFGYVTWGTVGIYLGERRLRWKIRDRKAVRRGRRTGVTVMSVVKPVFLFEEKQVIMGPHEVRLLDDVPDWVIEYVDEKRSKG